MKAKAIKAFQKTIRGLDVDVNVGDLLDVFQENKHDSGEIRIDGEYLCDRNSPFANEYFRLIDELEVEELPKTDDADRLYRIRSEGYTNLPYEDVAWLVQQAEKAKSHEKWLNRIAEIDKNAFTATDASYWALLALGKV